MDNAQKARAILRLATEAAEHQAAEFERFRAGNGMTVNPVMLTIWFADWQMRLRAIADADPQDNRTT